jgi:hypothetical protein
MKKNLLLAVFSSVMTLLAIEICLRNNLIPNDFYSKMKEIVPDGGERKRVLFLGDSFAADWKEEERMNDILEQRFLEKKFRILNLARGGYGPLEYAFQFKTFGMAYRPDLVILFYYAGNDLTDVQYELSRKKSPTEEKFKDSFRPYVHHIYLYHFYKEFETAWQSSRMKDWSKFANRGFSQEILDLVTQRKINYNFLDKSQRPEHFQNNVFVETEENLEAWEKCTQYLAEIHELCEGIHSQFVIVIIPLTTQINDHQFWLFQGMKFTVDERMLTSERPQELMIAFCGEKGIPCLDLLPRFREHRDEDFFRPYDVHFARNGDEFAAQLVYDYLEENGFLD